MNITIVANQMLVLFLMMLLGFYAFKKDILSDESVKKLSGLIVNITNPAFILSGVISGERIGNTNDLILVFILAVGMHLGLMLVAIFIPIILKVPRTENGLYKVMTVFSNIGFMGFPIISSIFGKEVLLYGAIFVLPFNVLAYTYGIHMLKKDSQKDKKIKFDIKRILNVGVIACIISIIIFIFEIKLPNFAIKTIDMIGGITTPVSMLVIGAALGKIKFKELFTDVRLYFFSFIKLILIPVAVLFILKNFIVNETILATAIILLATPVASMSVMLSTEFGGNVKVASKGVLLTTILSVITIPIIVGIFTIVLD